MKGLTPLVVLAVVALAAFAGCSTAPPRPRAAVTTAAATNLPRLVSSFTADLVTESTANKTYASAFSTTTADITEQEDKATLDAAAQANDFGQGCNALDGSTYQSCVGGEEQTAANARKDTLTAQSQLDAAYQQYVSSADTYELALGTFVGKVDALSWPGSYKGYVNLMVTAARAVQLDLSLQAAVTISTAPSSVSAINAQTGLDIWNFSDAVNVLRAALANN